MSGGTWGGVSDETDLDHFTASKAMVERPAVKSLIRVGSGRRRTWRRELGDDLDRRSACPHR